jgi:hypothetical protein
MQPKPNYTSKVLVATLSAAIAATLILAGYLLSKRSTTGTTSPHEAESQELQPLPRPRDLHAGPVRQEDSHRPAIAKPAVESASSPPVAKLEPGYDGRDAMALLKDAYLHEKKDSAWSDKAVQQINQAYATHLPEGATLRSVECRTSICRMELRYKDEESHHQFVKQTLFAREGMWNGPISAIITDRNEGDVGGLVYFGRQGHSFPGSEEGNPN